MHGCELILSAMAARAQATAGLCPEPASQAVVDPVGAGFVSTLARPGNNATGFMLIEYRSSAKWLELLKQVAPRVTRAAVMRDPTLAPGSGQLGAIQAVAPSLGVELTPIGLRNA